MSEVVGVSRPPKQERSRASFEKALDAAAELMAERGDDSFTLAEVVQRSGVSMGSIYGRVQGKSELVRAVQRRVLEARRPNQEQLLAMAERHQSLRTMLPALIDAWAEDMRRDSAVLRAIMWVATRDPDVAQAGAATHIEIKQRLNALLLRFRTEIRHPDPELAVEACLTITYSALARFLGFGTAADAAGQGDWISLKRELGVMSLAYLLYEETAG